ncbi:hypothetical protein [Marinicellulosiphila megalodicopiae]|uniref:hypothetical protein n=1 Tax=Marinicellulosiphila megalodicopiae TaxID=2724896 RepID=UPI003BAFFBE3
MSIKKTLSAVFLSALSFSSVAGIEKEGEYKILEARIWDDGSLYLILEDVNNPGAVIESNCAGGQYDGTGKIFTDLNNGAMTDRALTIALTAQMSDLTVNAGVHSDCVDKWGSRSQLTYIELNLD